MSIPDKTKYTDRVLHSDIEARGYLDAIHSADHVWCICSRDDETDEVFLFHDYPEYDNHEVSDDGISYVIPPRTGTLLEGVRFWYLAGHNGSKLSIHNLQQYDRLLVEKVWEKCQIPEEAWWDTFIQSKVQYFDRLQKKGAKSPHGLLNYSLMQGHKKPPVEDFTIMNAFMLHRCIIDTKTQKYCYNYLAEEASKLEKIGINFTEALTIENEYARNCARQEDNGVLADVPHMHRCIKAWDIRTGDLSEKIEPLLPPTVKVGSTRITRSAMMKSLGYNKPPPDEMETITRAGETKTQATKPYYKPSVNFHRTEKINNYSGFNISYGESPTFIKKNELTAWIKATHPDTKSNEWGIEKEVKETKVLNANTCKYFEVGELDIDIICGSHTRVSFSETKLTQHEQVKGYLIRYGGLTSCSEWNLKKDSDKKIVRVEQPTVVSYPPKAAPEHQLHYKISKNGALVTSPKVGEKEYEQITGELGKEIGEYSTTMHRRRYISNPSDPDNKGLLSFIREDGRIPAGVNNFGTSTGRGAQRLVVNLPSESSLLGEEMRRCLVAPDGRVLVGADMASAQLQICAFVTNNVVYYEAVAKGKELVKDPVTGKDVYQGNSAHCFNARAFNIIQDADWKECIRTQDPALMHKLSLQRKEAKGPAFASLFGCAPPKLATMLEIPVPEAKEKLENFLMEMGLDDVIAWLKDCSKKYKRGSGFYIPSAFGYWIYCKSMHSSVNYLIQSIEGAIQKVAINYFERNNKNPNVFKVLDVHDEYLVECPPELGEEVGELMGESYTYAGNKLSEWYKGNIDMYSGGSAVMITPDFNGGYAIGQSYYDCH